MFQSTVCLFSVLWLFACKFPVLFCSLWLKSKFTSSSWLPAALHLCSGSLPFSPEPAAVYPFRIWPPQAEYSQKRQRSFAEKHGCIHDDLLLASTLKRTTNGKTDGVGGLSAAFRLCRGYGNACFLAILLFSLRFRSCAWSRFVCCIWWMLGFGFGLCVDGIMWLLTFLFSPHYTLMSKY